jgi:hypothetical protein
MKEYRMTAMTSTIQIDVITVDDVGAFSPEIIGFIGHEVGGAVDEGSIVKFVVEIDADTVYGEGVSIAKGRTVKVDGIFRGVALEMIFMEVLSVGVVMTAVRLD